jgi:hypothetical protein
MTEEEMTAAKVLRQVEYYFSDESFPFDAFLKGKCDADGFVDLTAICAFKKMLSFTTDAAVVTAAIADSDVVELNDAKTKLKRRHPLPDADPDKARTCHVSGFGVGDTQAETEAGIKTAMAKFGAVASVRALRNLSQETRALDGSAFVVFEDAAAVETGCACTGSVMGGRKILIHALADWFARLGKKRDAMTKKRDQRAEDLKNGVVRAPQEQGLKREIVLGCVLKFEGLDAVDGADREMLKAACEVEEYKVRYVEFERGQAEGYCRLDGAVAADLLAKIATDGKVDLAGTPVAALVLEGDAEQDYWARAAQAAKDARGKRKHGGGRGKGGYRKKHRKG